VVKHFVPDPAERAEMRWKRKVLAMRQFHDVDYAMSDEEIAKRMRGKLKFYSLTLQKVREDSVATIFIVRTYKPIRWIEFMRRVYLALEDLL